jgi:hypothetical protein
LDKNGVEDLIEPPKEVPKNDSKTPKVHNNLRKKENSNNTNLISKKILGDPYIPKKSYTWIPPNKTVSKDSCPGCGARYGCYCK